MNHLSRTIILKKSNDVNHNYPESYCTCTSAFGLFKHGIGMSLANDPLQITKGRIYEDNFSWTKKGLLILFIPVTVIPLKMGAKELDHSGKRVTWVCNAIL